MVSGLDGLKYIRMHTFEGFSNLIGLGEKTSAQTKNPLKERGISICIGKIAIRQILSFSGSRVFGRPAFFCGLGFAASFGRCRGFGFCRFRLRYFFLPFYFI